MAPPPRPNPPMQTRGAQPLSNGIPCPTCHRMHPLGPGLCWVESGVICGNCGGNHPTERCRRPPREPSLGNTTTSNPPPNLFYNRPPQGTQQGYYINPQPAQWYPQGIAQPHGSPMVTQSSYFHQPPKVHQVPNPSSSHVHSQYYMGIHPTPPHMQRGLTHQPPIVSQDARNEVVFHPNGAQFPTSSSQSELQGNQSANMIIHELETQVMTSTSHHPPMQHVAVMTRQQRLNNPSLDAISKETSSIGDAHDVQAMKNFVGEQTREILQEPPLDNPSMEDAPLYELLSDEEDDLHRFVEPMEMSNQEKRVSKNRQRSMICGLIFALSKLIFL